MAVISVTLRSVGDTTTEAHIRQHTILINRPEENGGQDTGAMGFELLLASLGGCFGSNLLAVIRKRDLPIDDITIEVNGTLSESSMRYEAIEMIVYSSYEDREELKKHITVAERSCIVANTLKDAVALTVRVEENN